MSQTRTTKSPYFLNTIGIPPTIKTTTTITTISTIIIFITILSTTIPSPLKGPGTEYDYPFKFEPQTTRSNPCPPCQSRECKFERCHILGKLTNFSSILPDRKLPFELVSFTKVLIESLDHSFFRDLKIRRLVFLDCKIEYAIVWNLFGGIKKLDEVFFMNTKNLADLIWNYQFMEPLFDKLRGLKISSAPRKGVNRSFLGNFEALKKVIIIGPMKDIKFLSYVRKLTFLYLMDINVNGTNFLNFKNVQTTLEYLILNNTQDLSLNEQSFNKLTKLKYLEVIGEAKVYLNFQKILNEIEFLGSSMILQKLRNLGMIVTEKTMAPSTSDHFIIRSSAGDGIRLFRSFYIILMAVEWMPAYYKFH